MIKNNRQLKIAQSKLAEIKQQIEEYHKQYSGVELDLYITPLCYQEAELQRSIEEYLELRRLNFKDAIKGPLDKPFLLDNISELLAKLRIAAKMTQGELADLLGWEQSNLARFESENYSSQTIAKVVEYASALDVWLHVIPSLTEKPQKPLFSFRKIESSYAASAPTG